VLRTNFIFGVIRISERAEIICLHKIYWLVTIIGTELLDVGL